ncbi:dTDP-4-dehydrorhamnose 3,5-epimerase [Tsuneonella dongtanensis]|uniref:dTDP-4-dehydrorhamnose 3,5-epimerase n=1 Tax=Tsuneonella dongtanensis TaxID=692370 RepID=A0A1B2A9S7_9SPHN|nr:dTDP-4-dehydrorhamnose 3,5-epimerase [Tsuneonella dongtanensis]ANY18933.1 dTDP-4-dehydrorhamnose 3,5-epimerase [Tsuneonella dongtanensis]
MTSFKPTEIPAVVEIVPQRFGDHRGWFSEVYKRPEHAQAGYAIDWMQDNQSFSAPAGTVRGLHFQVPPVAQDKLVRVLSGAVFDVAVDLRRGSPTYGKWVGRELTAEAGNQLLVPVGFAHCFMTLVPDTHVLYKVSAPWSKDHEGAIRWDDPSIGIDWPVLDVPPTLSDKDRDAPLLADFDSPFVYESR